MFFMPASNHSCLASFKMTGTPFWMKQMAMPVPIKPAPTMPTFLMGAGFSFKPGTLLAKRSEKKRCLNAADCTLKSSFLNCRPSSLTPSSKLMLLQAASTHLMIAAGAIMPLAFWEAWFKVISKAPPRALKRVAAKTGRLEMGLGGMESANLAASSTTLDFTIASRIPALCAFAALRGAPVKSMGRKTSRGATRGIRWVPSPPGKRPRVTSGRPTLTEARPIR
mmetsp:Transcript_66723/g.144963  ORF Transcript_66723/g.144963 Transcript_66723/m.144963 type:complete len:223 (+) Transcript_66723:1373-2041(+)